MYNSYIPQTEHPKCKCCSVWGMQLICWMFPPNNPLPHPHHLHPFHFVFFNFKNLAAKQYATNIQSHLIQESSNCTVGLAWANNTDILTCPLTLLLPATFKYSRSLKLCSAHHKLCKRERPLCVLVKYELMCAYVTL